MVFKKILKEKFLKRDKALDIIADTINKISDKTITSIKNSPYKIRYRDIRRISNMVRAQVIRLRFVLKEKKGIENITIPKQT